MWLTGTTYSPLGTRPPYFTPSPVNNIRGYLPLKVVHFVMNLHTLPRTFFLTRHGQSEYNLLGKIGGDSGLTPAGKEYARRLAEFARDVIATEPTVGTDPDAGTGDGPPPTKPRPARLWTSTLRRTKETAHFIEHDVRTLQLFEAAPCRCGLTNSLLLSCQLLRPLNTHGTTVTKACGCSSVPWPAGTWTSCTLVRATG